MKVFEINVVYGTGSTGHIVARLKQAVESEGGSCMAAYGRGTSHEADTCRIGSDPDMYYHALMSRLTDQTAFYSKKSTRELIRGIKEYQPDLIHLHNLHGYFIHVELLFEFLKEYGKPVLWTLHDCWPFTGHCPYFTRAQCEKWKTHCSDCPQKKEYPASFFRDCSGRNYERKKAAFTGVDGLTIVTPSRWLAGLAGQSFLKEYPVRVIPNGIDLRRFAPQKSEFRSKYHLEGKFVLLGVANLWTEKRKGLADFIALARLLGEDYRIVLVGGFGKKMPPLPSNVICLSRTESITELVELYSGADLFLNLTYEDNYPTVNLEALACGTPVLTYDSGGSPESVSRGGGFVVPPGDLRETAAKIREYRKDPGQICLEEGVFDRGFLDEERYIKEYLELMREAVSDRIRT